jgi:endonuclease YncB( thermonuclease family)
MLKNILLVPLFLSFLVSPAFAKDPLFVRNGKITKVSDGDTVHFVDGNGMKLRVRLYGIDAPETPKMNRRTGNVSKPGQPYGEEAEEALRSKILGKLVTLEIMDKDRYNRMVSVIRLDGRDINQEMVAEGWAWAYRQYLDRPHASEYVKLEELARKEKRGLWKQSNPQPPWEFRKNLRIR